jgi:sugar diacid utilization regulator
VLNGYSAKRQGISESSVDLLTILANQVATAIESIHLRDEQKENIERLALANESLRRQSQLLEQAHEVHKRLNDVALGPGGVEDICAALTELLNRPVFIEDVHGRCLAGRPSDFPDLAPDAAKGLIGDLLEAKVPGAALPEFLTVAPVHVSGEIAARIWVRSRLDALSDLDRRALESATIIVALELMRLRAAQEVEWRVQGDLVDALLQGDSRILPQLIGRAQALGHDLEVSHRIVLLSLPPEAAATAQGPVGADALTRAMKRTTASFLESAGPKPLITVHDARIVILIPVDDAADIVTSIEQLHRRIATRHGVSVQATLGPVSDKLEDYARSFRIARGAALLHERHGFSAGVLRLEDLGIASLLLQVESPGELADFADRTIGGLADHDAAKSSSLEETLRMYFNHGCNVAEAASELFVHPNTVKLRLRKIESLLNRDLSDPEDVLNLRAAVLISDIMNPPQRKS